MNCGIYSINRHDQISYIHIYIYSNSIFLFIQKWVKYPIYQSINFIDNQFSSQIVSTFLLSKLETFFQLFLLSYIAVICSGSFSRNFFNLFIVLSFCVATLYKNGRSRWVRHNEYMSTSQLKVTYFEHRSISMKVPSTHLSYGMDPLSTFFKDLSTFIFICL